MIEDLREHWYAIYPSHALRKRPVGLLRFGERFVLWRTEGGAVAALPDACPHRRVALSGGKVVDGCIECPFHGFRFDADGRCTSIPAQGPEAPPDKYRARTAPAVAEGHGYIWMWRGEAAEELPPLPWFDSLEGLRPNRGFSSTWTVHYSRAIENQLDFTHLPFVHASSIGHGVAETMEVECRVSERSIVAHRTGDTARLEFLLPNLWTLRITDALAMQAAFFPVDAATSVTHIRAFQGFVRVPGLAQIVGWAMSLNNRWVLSQDRRVVESSDPPRFDPDAPEMLVRSDAPMLAYRRLILRERKRLASTPDVASTSLRRHTA